MIDLAASIRALDAKQRDQELLDAVADYIRCPVVEVHRFLGDHNICVSIGYRAAEAVVDVDDCRTSEEIADRLAVAGRAAWWAYEPPPDPPNIIRGDQ